MVNMLVKKPHDISFYGSNNYSWADKFNENRKHIHLLDINTKEVLFKSASSFDIASRHKKNRGFRRSSVAFYSENFLEGYDYVSAKAGCRKLSLEKQYFPHNFAWLVNKASVWGRYKKRYRNVEDPNRPQGQDFYDSHLSINIPSEIISTVFKDAPVGGQ